MKAILPKKYVVIALKAVLTHVHRHGTDEDITNVMTLGFNISEHTDDSVKANIKTSIDALKQYSDIEPFKKLVAHIEATLKHKFYYDVKEAA